MAFIVPSSRSPCSLSGACIRVTGGTRPGDRAGHRAPGGLTGPASTGYCPRRNSSGGRRPRRRIEPESRGTSMDWTLEVVILPVSDIDRSVAFYRDQVGFHLDHDTRNEHMHVVQLTPPGSGCSIVFGDLPMQREMQPGSMRGLQLCVADADAARAELLGRGV